MSILLLLLGQVQFYFHFIADSQCLKAPISLALRTTIRTGPKLTGEAAGTNPLISSDDSSNRCGVLIDGQYIEPQSGRDKITYECGCLDKSTQCIVWGFVLSEDHKTPPTPAPRDSPPPQVQRNAVPRLKVVMQRQRTQKDDLSATRVEALLSDNSFPVGSSSELPPLSPIESWRIPPFDEGRDRSLPSLPSTFGRLQFADQHGANQNNFGLWQAAAHHNRPIMVKEM